MKKIFHLVLFLVLLALLTAPISAAVKLEYQGKQSTEDASGDVTSDFPTKETVYLSKGIAISETENLRIVVDLKEDVMTYFIHPEKIYTKIALPIHLEDYADEEQLDLISKLVPIYEATRFKLEASSDIEKLGAWNVRKTQTEAEMVDGSVRFEITAWLSTEVPVDPETYNALSRSRLALSLFTRVWADRVLEPEGMAVRQRTVIITSSQRTIDDNELVSIEEDIEIPPEKLRPPEGYREVPFDLARWTGIGYKPTRRLPPREP